MKNFKVILTATLFLLLNIEAFSQCTPVNCLSTLPAYGGLCDSAVADGRVNTPYYDFISFHVTNTCVDAGLIDPGSAGIGLRITSIHSFTFTGLPAGLTAMTNQATYVPNANGCASISGTPTQAGVFVGTVTFMVNANAWLFSVTCGGIFPPVAQNNNPVSGDLNITVLPDPSFTAPDSVFCVTSPDVVLTPTGTTGGTFSGPGVTGNMFSPSAAGVGTHIIKYIVSAQQGTSIAPATDSLSIVITVTAPTNTFYADADGDGFGDPLSTIIDCIAPAGYVTNNLDCDDTDNTVGQAVDVFYADADGDSFGDPNSPVIACSVPAGYVTNNLDCDDTDNTVGQAVDVFYADADGDSFGDPNSPVIACSVPAGYVTNNLDCDDTDNTIGEAVDVFYADADGDSFGDPNSPVIACSVPAGYVTNNLDCDDTDNTIGEAVDVFYADADGDSFGDPNSPVIACSVPAGYVTNNLDCDDTDNTIGEAVDVFYADVDGDSFGDPNSPVIACTVPAGYVTNNLDCDDTDNTIGEAVDVFYADADGDSYGDPNTFVVACTVPAGYVINNLDCDDTNNMINPGMIDIPDNGIDEDCSGADSTLVGLAQGIMKGIRLFPNPGNNKFYIESQQSLSGEVDILIRNVLGSLVQESTQPANRRTFVTDTSTLLPGVYFISFRNNGTEILMKWIKYQEN